MEFHEPKAEFVAIDMKEVVCLSSDVLCTPNDGEPGGGWHCSNNAWAYNNCGKDASYIC